MKEKEIFACSKGEFLFICHSCESRNPGTEERENLMDPRFRRGDKKKGRDAPFLQGSQEEETGTSSYFTGVKMVVLQTSHILEIKLFCSL
ncbi:hypothetical protein H5U35_07250 [Candidatus Aerophobetes bacterium]|nr:hypothetical protein [Candidatus Aerophobetes bacterium]